MYAGVRENVESVDLEQFGQEVQANVSQAQAQVQANVAQVQSQVEEKVAQVRGKSSGNGTATDEAAAEADSSRRPHVLMWARWSGDLRRWSKAGRYVSWVDPDDQLESIGASPLVPTIRSGRS